MRKGIGTLTSNPLDLQVFFAEQGGSMNRIFKENENELRTSLDNSPPRFRCFFSIFLS